MVSVVPAKVPPTRDTLLCLRGLWHRYYYYGSNSDASASSMLWIIISVASVFVIVTSILGFVVYRRRQARLRARAARAENAPRAVTEIELDEVDSLPYVERVQDDAAGGNTAALPVAQSLTVVPSRTTSPRIASRQSSFASGLTLRPYNEAGSDQDDDDGGGGDHHSGARFNEESYMPGAGHSPVMQGHVRRVTAGADTGAAYDSADIPVATASLTCMPSLAPLRLEELRSSRYRTESVGSLDSAGGGSGGGGDNDDIDNGDNFLQPAFSSWTFEGAAAGVELVEEEGEDSHDEAVTPSAPGAAPQCHQQYGGGGGGGGDAAHQSEDDNDEDDEDFILARALSLSMQHDGDDAAESTAAAGGGAGAGAGGAAAASGAAAPSGLHCVEDESVQLHDSGNDNDAQEDEEDAQSEATADIASDSDEDGEAAAAEGGVGFRAW